MLALMPEIAPWLTEWSVSLLLFELFHVLVPAVSVSFCKGFQKPCGFIFGLFLFSFIQAAQQCSVKNYLWSAF